MSTLRNPNAAAIGSISISRWLPSLATVASVLLVASGLLLGLRRLALFHAEPLALIPTLLTALLVTLTTIVLRWFFLRHLVSQHHFGLSDLPLVNSLPTSVLKWSPSLVIILWAVACSFPGSQWAAWIIWIAAMAFDAAATNNLAQQFRQQEHPVASLPVADSTEQPTPCAIVLEVIERDVIERDVIQSDREAKLASMLDAAAPMPVEPTFESPEKSLQEEADPSSMNLPTSDDETVLQNVLRVRDAAGQEYVYATLRGEFQPGERLTTLYVGFCPPFASLPNVEAEVIDGAPGVAKVIQAMHNGVQIEVDLDDPSLEAAHVMVEVAAFVPQSE